MRCKQCLEKFGTSRNPSHEEAVWIAACLKQARAEVLADGERWLGVVQEVERLGSRLLPRECRTKCDTLHSKEPFLKELVKNFHPLKAVTEFSSLVGRMRKWRNEAVHGGGAARVLARNAVELAIFMEDTLMEIPAGEKNKETCPIRDWMVPNPVRAFDWHTVGDVRRMMLGGGFSTIPVRLGEKWRLLLDDNLAKWLRSGSETGQMKKRKEKLAMCICQAVEKELEVLEADEVGQDENVWRVLEKVKYPRAILVTREGCKRELVGIVTSSDLM